MNEQKKNKTVSIRIDADMDKFLKEKYKVTSTGLGASADAFKYIAERAGTVDYLKITETIDILQQLRAYSLRELNNIFNDNHWKYLADCLNGILISSNLRCNSDVLAASVEDSDYFGRLAHKWDIDDESFIDIIKELTGAQVDAVYAEIERFWTAGIGYDTWQRD